jgi:hypothetical protein
MHIITLLSLIHFPVGHQLGTHRAPFGVSVITHAIRHTVGLLWMSEYTFILPDKLMSLNFNIRQVWNAVLKLGLYVEQT